MAFKPNYGLQRNDRRRAAQARSGIAQLSQINAAGKGKEQAK
jgi:hypothetical protein